MKLIDLYLAFFVLISLGACAVNRVDYVHSPGDALSAYKVPVVVGSGVTEDSVTVSSLQASDLAFAEYDVESQKATGSCLGSANVIWVGFKKDKGNKHSKISYTVMMVPPGDYALSSWSGAHPYEAKPSLYFHVSGGNPLYLGNFIFRASVPEEHKEDIGFQKIETLPVQYDDVGAIQALKQYDIHANEIEHIKLIPVDRYAEAFLCTP